MSEAFNQDPVWNAQSDDSILRDTVDYQYVKFENQGDVSDRDNYTVFSTDRSSY